jgi:hypothetical protein
LAGTGRSRPTAASACRHAVLAGETPGAPYGRMNPGHPARLALTSQAVWLKRQVLLTNLPATRVSGRQPTDTQAVIRRCAAFENAHRLATR